MLQEKLFSITTSEEFESLALEVFQHQFKEVKVYRDFCQLLKVDPTKVTTTEAIPFLPIQFFKEHRILGNQKISEKTFTSSGTTGNVTSNHFVASLSLYEESFMTAFIQRYGDPKDWVILALLPSYLERDGSSLVYMVDHLIDKSEQLDSGFYLHDLQALTQKIKSLEARGQQTLLIGVSYALLDLIETETFQLNHTLVMETGGMKGKRKEMVKAALHERLSEGFGLTQIHSEYGMTELLSQAYSQGQGIFHCPPWMKVLTRDPEDALSLVHGKTGGINVIDLANYHSCSFIATQDLGKTHALGSFEILGRFDNSDIRGCNLMMNL